MCETTVSQRLDLDIEHVAWFVVSFLLVFFDHASPSRGSVRTEPPKSRVSGNQWVVTKWLIGVRCNCRFGDGCNQMIAVDSGPFKYLQLVENPGIGG